MIEEFKKRLLSSLIIIPIAIFFTFQGSVFFMFFLGILFLATSYEWLKMSKNNKLKFLGIIFLMFSFYATFEIREYNSFEYFLFIVTVCIFTDIGGYLFGKTFKGPKLVKISPNKTYAGVFGSFFLALTAGLIYLNYFSKTEIDDTDFIFLLILFISFISQIGDLIISYFKRKAKLKDTGKILPGHGGLLDRIDGLVFVMPIIYLLSKI